MARHLIELIGNVKLDQVKMRDVQCALGKLAERFSTRSVRLARMILIQAIRNAMVNDLVVRNVAELTTVPTGQPGRPSRSLNLEQALAVLDAAKGEGLWPYVAVSMLGGIRTEEARALRWSEVDLEAGTVTVYRSVRRTGETKTEKPRRVFQIPEIAVEALRELVLKQAAARAKAGRPLQHPDNRGRIQAPAPAGYPYRCHRAGPAVREQGKTDGTRKLSSGCQLGCQDLD